MTGALLAGLIGGAVGVLATYALSRLNHVKQVRRVRAAERRARSAERLAELGAMTSGLAHEIKNPLSTLGLNAELLREAIEELDADADDKGAIVRRIDNLKRETERLRGILEDFLQFAGELRLDRSPADLNGVVGELVDFFLPQAERQGVRVRTDLAGEPLIGQLDAPTLKQAVLNLMLNAVQAMSASEMRELILRTHSGTDEDGAPTVVLHVIDTGPGMSAETKAKIFEPYFSTKSGGTGLGLPTTRRIIDAHGGTVEAHSEIGRGTDFVVTLPGEEMAK